VSTNAAGETASVNIWRRVAELGPAPRRGQVGISIGLNRSAARCSELLAVVTICFRRVNNLAGESIDFAVWAEYYVEESFEIVGVVEGDGD
jgi:hypothetical protein